MAALAFSAPARALRLRDNYIGWSATQYSNRTRGYRKQHALLGDARVMAPAPGGEARAPLEVRRSWARLIRQAYEVDPLLCPQCGGTMKVIAVIERPAIIRQILDHLGLPTAAPSFRAPPHPPREWSYEPLFDLPVRRSGAGQTGDLPVPDPMLA